LIFFGSLIFKNYKSLKENFAKNNLSKYIVVSLAILGLTSFIVGTPIESLNKFTTLQGIRSLINKPPTTSHVPTAKSEGLESSTTIQLGGTESSKIRLIVWQGAIEIFKQHPLFGSGVETYAYAYYGVKPLAHNLTSEWDYLYNKAHNEYLNYLATTGAFGLATYLSIIGVFFYYVFKQFSKHQSRNFPISLGIVGGYAAILVSNFFGFSVVVINLFIFAFPILFFDLEDNKTLRHVFAIPKTYKDPSARIAPAKAAIIVFLGLIALYYEFFLFNFWNADKKYALGNNLDKASEYVQAYTPLAEAVKMLPQEDLYKDELSINMATLALLLAEQKNATQAAEFGQQARALSDAVTSAHPNNIVFLKTRARVAFALSEIDPASMDLAIATIERARKLAPTDAKLVYNEGLFYNQKGDQLRAIQYVSDAIKLKPNYIDAYYTLALYYSQLAKKGDANSFEYRQKARNALEYTLKNIDPNHKASQELLKSL
jgi:putative inorganic carbon (HCO3(-)) transporter